MNSTNTQSREQQLAKRRAEQLASSRAYAASRFGLTPDEVIGYNSGSAYDKIWVKTRAAAERVASKVAGEKCNGGWFHGMALGGISTHDGIFEVMC